MDNCQPWQFVVRQGGVELHLDEDRAEFFGDYAHAASYVTFGTIIENKAIATLHHGFACRPELFPDGARPRLMVTLRFEAVTAATVSPGPDPGCSCRLGLRLVSFPDRFCRISFHFALPSSQFLENILLNQQCTRWHAACST